MATINGVIKFSQSLVSKVVTFNDNSANHNTAICHTSQSHSIDLFTGLHTNCIVWNVFLSAPYMSIYIPDTATM